MVFKKPNQKIFQRKFRLLFFKKCKLIKIQLNLPDFLENLGDLDESNLSITKLLNNGKLYFDR